MAFAQTAVPDERNYVFGERVYHMRSKDGQVQRSVDRDRARVKVGGAN
jgi:hypothetical protein